MFFRRKKKVEKVDYEQLIQEKDNKIEDLLESAKKRKEQFNKKMSELNAKSSEIEDLKESLLKKEQELEDELESYEDRGNALDVREQEIISKFKEIEEAQQELSEKSKALEAERESFKGLESEINERASEIESKFSEFYKLQGEQKQLEARQNVFKDISFEGELKSGVDMVLQGLVKGDVLCAGSVYVDASSTVDGSVKGASVFVSGRVEGDVFSDDLLQIEETGFVCGSVQTKRLQIELGGMIEGGCKMITNAMTKKDAGKNITPFREVYDSKNSSELSQAPKRVAAGTGN